MRHEGVGKWVSLSLRLAVEEQGEAWCAGWGLQTGGQSGGEKYNQISFGNVGCLDITAVADTSYH